MNTYLLPDGTILYTSHTANTTPNRDWDWGCCDSSYSDGDSISGLGPSESEAINEYFARVDECE